MNITAKIDQIDKRLETKLGKEEVKTILFLTKEDDERIYDYWAWKEKGEFQVIDTSIYPDKNICYLMIGGIDRNGNVSHGFIPPLKREDFG